MFLHFIITTLLLLVNSLYIFRLGYSAKKGLSPKPGDFLLRRLAAALWFIDIASGVRLFSFYSHSLWFLGHLALLLLPMVIEAAFRFLPLFKKQHHTLRQSLIQHLSIFIAYLILCLNYLILSR
ncbi:MAG: hypothetical protein FWE37_05955 [Spirochaetaceae bacterium]|nr:hypothetical protein [Spirochaetaceae bacterium]